jgi:hypothetical protein
METQEIYYTIRQAAEITGSSVPRFYSNKDKFAQFKVDPSRPRSDYAIPRSFLIAIGWLNPDGTKRKGETSPESRVWIEENNKLQIELEQAHQRIKVLETSAFASSDSNSQVETLTEEVKTLQTRLEVCQARLEMSVKEAETLRNVFKDFGTILNNGKK